MLTIPSEIYCDIVNHAKALAPIEACGLLAGVAPHIRKSYRLTNVDNAVEHFSLDPKEQFAAVKDMRALGIEMLAVYHSHPATPARMSEEDLRLAYTPDIHYVIISLENPKDPVIKGFQVADGNAVEVPISVLSHENES